MNLKEESQTEGKLKASLSGVILQHPKTMKVVCCGHLGLYSIGPSALRFITQERRLECNPEI